MQKLDNRRARLQKYVGKTFTPRNNGIFVVDRDHRVKIKSISISPPRIIEVHYTYVHVPRTQCPRRNSRSKGGCSFIQDTFKQSVTSFFSYVDWRERGNE